MAVGDYQPDFSSNAQPSARLPGRERGVCGQGWRQPAARSVVQVSKDLLVRSD
jgi:hypothetical protein